MPNGLLNAYRRPRRHTLHFCFGARDQRIASYSMNRKNAPLTAHNALKLEKSAISKVQKTFFAISEMAKNQFLHQKKV